MAAQVARRLADHRIRILVAVFALVFLGSLARAAWLQVVRAASLGAFAQVQQRETVELPAHRGTIFDRTGVQLAIGEEATTVYADPRQVRNPRRVALAAAHDLGVDANDLYRRLLDRRHAFLYVERQADPERAARLRRRHLAGLGFYPEERRTYPQGSLAAQVIGYAGVDNQGLAGLELQLNRKLAGTSGRETVVKDPFGHPIDVIASKPERPGRSVFLTVDHRLETNVEGDLRQAVARWHAKGATAIVLDPRNGDVLAMANAPMYDANDFPHVWPPLERNRAVEAAYEPGSTFKVVTVAGALADGLVSPSTSFWLPPSIRVVDKVIHDAEPRPAESMTVAQILAHSSNVGAVRLAQLLGRDRLARWIARFGFGKKTGIGFPAESPGIVLPPDHWYGSAIGTVPIGQGIAVTPIQLAAAYAAIANHGIQVQPHLLDHLAGSPRVRPHRRRVLSSGVAAELSAMLRGVVLEGTGTMARVPGYEVAGKTGTAAKALATGGYSSYRYVASFVGFVPASKPRFVILVAVDEPQGAIYGGVVAAPVFQEIAKFALQYYGVPPDAAAPSS